jgi:prophage DNA circulation protein
MSQPQLRDLTGRGYPSTDVLQNMQASQMRVPQMRELPPLPAPPMFRPSASPMSRSPTSTEEMQEIAEAIISEKWQKFGKEFDELKRSQEDISSTISGMQERISGVEKKMDMVIQEILGRVEEYGKGISDVGTELKAMQKVFGTVMPSFTENVKELQELVGDAKTQGFQKPKRKKK